MKSMSSAECASRRNDYMALVSSLKKTTPPPACGRNDSKLIYLHTLLARKRASKKTWPNSALISVHSERFKLRKCRSVEMSMQRSKENGTRLGPISCCRLFESWLLRFRGGSHSGLLCERRCFVSGFPCELRLSAAEVPVGCGLLVTDAGLPQVRGFR